MTKTDKPKCHSLIITGKVQDIGFRSIVEHIGRSFGMPGVVYNTKDGSVNILCTGVDSVIENFTQTIKARGEESGAEIEDIIKKGLHDVIALPEHFTKLPSDDEIDIGRKLDKGNEFLKNLPEMNEKLNTLPEMNNTLKSLPDIKDMLGSSIAEQRDYNRGQQEHNTRLEAILQKLVEKA